MKKTPVLISIYLFTTTAEYSQGVGSGINV